MHHPFFINLLFCCDSESSANNLSADLTPQLTNINHTGAGINFTRTEFYDWFWLGIEELFPGFGRYAELPRLELGRPYLPQALDLSCSIENKTESLSMESLCRDFLSRESIRGDSHKTKFLHNLKQTILRVIQLKVQSTKQSFPADLDAEISCQLLDFNLSNTKVGEQVYIFVSLVLRLRDLSQADKNTEIAEVAEVAEIVEVKREANNLILPILKSDELPSQTKLFSYTGVDLECLGREDFKVKVFERKLYNSDVDVNRVFFTGERASKEYFSQFSVSKEVKSQLALADLQLKVNQLVAISESSRKEAFVKAYSSSIFLGKQLIATSGSTYQISRETLYQLQNRIIPESELSSNFETKSTQVSQAKEADLSIQGYLLHSTLCWNQKLFVINQFIPKLTFDNGRELNTSSNSPTLTSIPTSLTSPTLNLTIEPVNLPDIHYFIFDQDKFGFAEIELMGEFLENESGYLEPELIYFVNSISPPSPTKQNSQQNFNQKLAIYLSKVYT